jgi:hypothetical protein
MPAAALRSRRQAQGKGRHVLHRRRFALVSLLLTAVLTVTLGVAPKLCHAGDSECQSDASHHTDLGCQCSCYMAAVLPGDHAAAPVLLLAALATAVEIDAPSFSPPGLDRPPRR